MSDSGNKTTEILVPYAAEVVEPFSDPAGTSPTVYEPGGPPLAMLVTFNGTGVFPRYRLDGGEPSATLGHVIPEGGSGVTIHGTLAIQRFRAIEPDEAAVLRITYFRGGN